MKPDASTDEIRTMMDERYAKGEAYALVLPFDAMRMDEIEKTVLGLAGARHCHTLDVGSGTGGIARYWTHKDIVGVEISAEAVAVARKRYPWVEYHVSPIETWSPNPKSFDLCVAVESIEHWSNTHLGLDTIRRSLKTGGMFVMTTPNRDSLHIRMGRKLGMEVPKCSYDHTHEFGFQELIDCVSSHGFELEESRGICLAPYWAIEEKLGHAVRPLTDSDPEVNRWLNDIGRSMPAEYGFLQAHRFVAR